MSSLETQLEAHRAVMVQVIEERDKAVRERDAAVAEAQRLRAILDPRSTQAGQLALTEPAT